MAPVNLSSSHSHHPLAVGQSGKECSFQNHPWYSSCFCVSALAHRLIMDCPSNLLLLTHSPLDTQLRCQFLQEAFPESPEQTRGPSSPVQPAPARLFAPSSLSAVSGLGKVGSRETSSFPMASPRPSRLSCCTQDSVLVHQRIPSTTV